MILLREKYEFKTDLPAGEYNGFILNGYNINAKFEHAGQKLQLKMGKEYDIFYRQVNIEFKTLNIN